MNLNRQRSTSLCASFSIDFYGEEAVVANQVHERSVWEKYNFMVMVGVQESKKSYGEALSFSQHPMQDFSGLLLEYFKSSLLLWNSFSGLPQLKISQGNPQPASSTLFILQSNYVLFCSRSIDSTQILSVTPTLSVQPIALLNWILFIGIKHVQNFPIISTQLINPPLAIFVSYILSSPTHS